MHRVKVPRRPTSSAWEGLKVDPRVSPTSLSTLHPLRLRPLFVFLLSLIATLVSPSSSYFNIQ